MSTEKGQIYGQSSKEKSSVPRESISRNVKELNQQSWEMRDNRY